MFLVAFAQLDGNQSIEYQYEHKWQKTDSERNGQKFVEIDVVRIQAKFARCELQKVLCQIILSDSLFIEYLKPTL